MFTCNYINIMIQFTFILPIIFCIKFLFAMLAHCTD